MSQAPLVNFNKYRRSLETVILTKEVGKLTRVVGCLLEGYLPGGVVGSLCHIYSAGTKKPILAEVIGFKDKRVLLLPFGETHGVGLGAQIILDRQVSTVKVGEQLLGRVLNGLGKTIDHGGPIEYKDEIQIYKSIINPLERKPIEQSLDLGVKAINGLTTVGKGQRVGFMAGSGVGKSVLLGMMAQNTKADVNVIALIGERGREVREFIERDLGPEGLKKSVLVVATGDESPLMRMRGAFVATAIAEYFSSIGKDVLFMMDSVTRFAMAQREIGLNVGEPPATKGYTPSVFSLLPKLLERVGSFDNAGSITGLYTVLVEGDDMDDPIADSVRSIVDGHVVLSRKLAEKGHFPAIDVLQSTSRVMRSVVDQNHLDMAIKMREHIAIYKEAEDLINIGAYKQGSNPKIDQAIFFQPKIEKYLRQRVGEKFDFAESVMYMDKVLNG